jgi:sulfur carrier protein ThiS
LFSNNGFVVYATDRLNCITITVAELEVESDTETFTPSTVQEILDVVTVSEKLYVVPVAREIVPVPIVVGVPETSLFTVNDVAVFEKAGQ